MKLIKGIKKRSIAEARSNVTLLIIAFICAIAAWFIVAMTMYPSESKEISNIPLNLDLSGTSAADSGLKLIRSSADTVRISFDCSRTDYSRINADTINAYVDFNNITTEGSKEMTVKIETTNGAALSNVSVYPPTVTVELDKYDFKVINVEPKVQNITLAEDKRIGEIKCEPEEITLTGPAAQLASISKCYAVSDKELNLDASYSLNSDGLLLLTEDGKEVDQGFITADPAVVSISIKVLTQKTVPFKVTISAPSNSNFDKSNLDFSITPGEITIASSTPDVNLTDEPLEIKIPLSALDIGYSKDFSIENMLAGKNVENVSGIENVNVTLNDEGLASKEITLSGENVDRLHVPSDGYDYSIVTQMFKVRLIGPSEVLNDITAADIDAEVDFFGVDTSKDPDQFMYDVSISCKSNNNVWAVETPKVNIRKTRKEGSTTRVSASANYTTATN